MYDDKSKAYFTCCRTDLLEFIPHNKNNRILEIGAGCGETLLKAKEMGLAERIVGVELMPIPNSNQTHRSMDRFIIGDIECMDLDFEDGYFDVILCGDVLEHLLDPWAVIKKLSRYLNQRGVFIASIPNFREINTIIKVVARGNFEYSDEGILDKTHLRFFCKRNIIDLFERNSLDIEYIGTDFDAKKQGKLAILNTCTFNLFYDLFVRQYYIVAKKRA